MLPSLGYVERKYVASASDTPAIGWRLSNSCYPRNRIYGQSVVVRDLDAKPLFLRWFSVTSLPAGPHPLACPGQIYLVIVFRYAS